MTVATDRRDPVGVIVAHADPADLWPAVADRLAGLAGAVGDDAAQERDRGETGPKTDLAPRLVAAAEALREWCEIAYDDRPRQQHKRSLNRLETAYLSTPPIGPAGSHRPGQEPNERCPDDHFLALWFSPGAIREHYPDPGPDGEPVIPAAVTDDDLGKAAADFLTGAGLLWEYFDQWVEEIVDDAKRAAQERDRKREVPA